MDYKISDTAKKVTLGIALVGFIFLLIGFFQQKDFVYATKINDHTVEVTYSGKAGVEKQNKLRKLEGVLQKARNEILENVKPILEELSKELGVTVILEKNSVLLSATNMDITENVIKKLNKELPKIKVSLD